MDPLAVADRERLESPAAMTQDGFTAPRLVAGAATMLPERAYA